MHAIAYRRDIDALRGLSVLLVVFFHAFPDIIPGGFIGVDIFFVISGYLITQIIIDSVYKNDFSLLEFYSRRIRRLFPALITVLLAAMFVGWLILFPDEYERLAEHVKYSSIYILNFILIGEAGYFDVESVYKPVLHLWTLSVEEQYYIFWPLILLALLKQAFLRPIYIISFIVLVSFAANIYFIEAYPENVYYNTLTRIWQLALGSFLGVYLYRKEIKERKYLCVSGLLLILSSALILNEDVVYPGWAALVPTLGAIMIIMANSRSLDFKVMVNVGLISYPLYLWHWLFISFLYIYIGQYPNSISMLSIIIFSFFFAYLTYRYIEKLRYAKGSFITITLLLLLLSIGVAGAYVSDKNGLPDRHNLSYMKKYNIDFTRPEMVDKQCEEYVKYKQSDERLFDYCRADALQEERYIAIIGDSHAHAIYPGISEEAQKRGYGVLLMANSSCPTLIGFEWGWSTKESDECVKKIGQIFSIIESDEKIDRVFMATRGPVYIHGEVDGGFTLENVNESLQIIRQEKLTYKTYFDGFRNTLERIQNIRHIREVFYFLENPELDFLPKEIVARPFDIWGISTNAATVKKGLYLLRMKKYRDLAFLYGKEFKILKIIDPMPYLCDSDKCYSFKEDSYLYADDDHLSVFGSKYIARRISGDLFSDYR